jgi:hypothetical protein
VKPAASTAAFCSWHVVSSVAHVPVSGSGIGALAMVLAGGVVDAGGVVEAG